jgi:hypothetical protein
MRILLSEVLAHLDRACRWSLALSPGVNFLVL